MPSNNVYRTYADLLKWHNKGYALWEPPLSEKMRPGSVGRLDEKGRWVPLYANIMDVPVFPEQRLTELKEVLDSSDTQRDFASDNFTNVSVNSGLAIE
jgi:hypothetical protein